MHRDDLVRWLDLRRDDQVLWLDTRALTELKACFSLLKDKRSDFCATDEDDVYKRFRSFGGIPRYVLEDTSMTVKSIMERWRPGADDDPLNVQSLDAPQLWTPASHQVLQIRVSDG